MIKAIGKIYQTDDYDIFKRLEGNRDVNSIRVKKIKKSINTVGYVLSPILVNKKFEVIDGQGRLEALKSLHLPIDYIVSEEAGINECIAMNINQTNWSIVDYIDSYAEMGNVSYMYLKQLIKRFGNRFRLVVICNAITNKACTPNDAIKAGDFTCTKAEYDNAVETLVYLEQFKPILDRLSGRLEYYYSALTFCFHDQQVDNDRLFKKLLQLQANLIPVSTVQQALDVIEDIYNNKIREKVYIKTNYRQYLNGKYKWYESRYNDKYTIKEDK